MRWKARHAGLSRMNKQEMNINIFIRKPQERYCFRNRRRRKDNIKMKPRGMSSEDMNWIGLAQDKI
jgi:hypothetical protein